MKSNLTIYSNDTTSVCACVLGDIGSPFTRQLGPGEERGRRKESIFFSFFVLFLNKKINHNSHGK